MINIAVYVALIKFDQHIMVTTRFLIVFMQICIMTFLHSPFSEINYSKGGKYLFS